jgi:hypothetical protein
MYQLLYKFYNISIRGIWGKNRSTKLARYCVGRLVHTYYGQLGPGPELEQVPP